MDTWWFLFRRFWAFIKMTGWSKFSVSNETGLILWFPPSTLWIYFIAETHIIVYYFHFKLKVPVIFHTALYCDVSFGKTNKKNSNWAHWKLKAPLGVWDASQLTREERENCSASKCSYRKRVGWWNDLNLECSRCMWKHWVFACLDQIWNVSVLKIPQSLLVLVLLFLPGAAFSLSSLRPGASVQLRVFTSLS